ncbi:hypothetical protein ACQEU5_15355 [Marinactinospora thermotolerans]|uniref:Uncharacterized protein n=1 Tax=Marinactinospora thermotolerans DSM 45154 TaxID=1122192 RepID=A0A1T4T8Y6_9ACTN|nr:hypothetical protein [Marinactinospora thermotolerans]SKA36618.1 hypothetical protein SAMN02745673_04613 [Marinactinospora thermotolerans DSM 45154]
MSGQEERTATWALVLAIIGGFLACFFILFLLLVEERAVGGSTMVTVHNGQACPGPGRDPGWFDYVRTLARSA